MQSRFQEGAQADVTKDMHFFTTLSEMDEHERRKRAHRGSSSSISSFSSAEAKYFAPKEGRRSISFGRSDGRGQSFDAPRDVTSRDNAAKGFKGRLRALTTGGRTATWTSKLTTGRNIYTLINYETDDYHYKHQAVSGETLVSSGQSLLGCIDTSQGTHALGNDKEFGKFANWIGKPLGIRT